MNANPHRRKNRRLAIRWKIAIVFGKALNRPILHTQTQDLSAGGAGIQTEYGDLTGAEVTVLLAAPPQQEGAAPAIMKIRARVVSSVQKPGQTTYRHGLSFIPAPGDGLEMLKTLLGSDAAPQADMTMDSRRTVAAAPAAPTETPATAAAAAAPAATGGGRLERLKQLAQAKMEEEKRAIVPPEDQGKAASDALKHAYNYLKELTGQLNVLKDPYTGKGYTIAGVPEFGGFLWDSSDISFRTREIAPEKKLWESVSLKYKLSANKQVTIKREYPASDRVKNVFDDYKIKYHTYDNRNERGAVVDVTFAFACEVEARMQFTTNFETGKVMLKMHNVERFGMLDYALDPAAINDASLEELTAFMLGETTRLGPLLLQGA